MTFLSKMLRSGRLFAAAMYQRRVPFLSIERLHALQDRRVRRIVRHACDTVPFYRGAMRDLGLRPEDFRTARDLARLPLIDSKLVRDNPAAFRSKLYDPKECVVLHSGGGGATAWDPSAALRQLAYAERDRAVWLKAGRLGLGQRQLHILSSGSSTFTLRAFWDRQVKTPRLVAQRHFLDPLEPYEKAVEALDRIRPDIAFSYGSYLEQFTRFLRDRGLSPAMPRVWVYGADSISEHWRNLVEREFGCMVYSSYLTTEMGRIGHECERRSGHHLNIDLCAVRFVREDGTDATPEEIGEIVVSNLVNRATVLLNYRLGDLAESSRESCPCGRTLPLMRRFHGRVSETVRTADGVRLSSTVLLGEFAGEVESALKVQVFSPEAGRILWKIVPSRELDREQFRLRLLARCREVFSETSVEVEYVEDIAVTPAGKFRSVIHSTEQGL